MSTEHLSLFEAAIYCKVHPNTIYRALRAGELDGIKRRTGWQISQKTLDRYLHKRNSDIRLEKGIA